MSSSKETEAGFSERTVLAYRELAEHQPRTYKDGWRCVKCGFVALPREMNGSDDPYTMHQIEAILPIMSEPDEEETKKLADETIMASVNEITFSDEKGKINVGLAIFETAWVLKALSLGKRVRLLIRENGPELQTGKQ
ncbi:hypothetical protein ACLQ8T_06100 [Glutamicibacter sp. FR1]|uniref:hypothetical protein n=1 Tax=Glutamicibacter sp. FR1 TaxID=3393744 RepID=UPI0039AF33E2